MQPTAASTAPIPARTIPRQPADLSRTLWEAKRKRTAAFQQSGKQCPASAVSWRIDQPRAQQRDAGHNVPRPPASNDNFARANATPANSGNGHNATTANNQPYGTNNSAPRSSQPFYASNRSGTQQSSAQDAEQCAKRLFVVRGAAGVLGAPAASNYSTMLRRHTRLPEPTAQAVPALTAAAAGAIHPARGITPDAATAARRRAIRWTQLRIVSDLHRTQLWIGVGPIVRRTQPATYSAPHSSGGGYHSSGGGGGYHGGGGGEVTEAAADTEDNQQRIRLAFGRPHKGRLVL